MCEFRWPEAPSGEGTPFEALDKHQGRAGTGACPYMDWGGVGRGGPEISPEAESAVLLKSC